MNRPILTPRHPHPSEAIGWLVFCERANYSALVSGGSGPILRASAFFLLAYIDLKILTYSKHTFEEI